MGSLYSKYKPANASLLVNGSVQLLSGLFCLVISFFAGEWQHFSPGGINTSSWLALSYLIVMGSIVTYLSYLYLLKKRTPGAGKHLRLHQSSDCGIAWRPDHE
jgi:drug/metabolite transporter (DMT)-like permease